ncbi:hypothetical protein VIGAN_01384600 [Vigna angularis var. angularis]|uniref:Uncharacterized protein n=1 Tax=Vigna angularis var. angularis TaxID=157739 RepID=A0A0S3R5W3_PHAAN|nr:hypothetical protein VIGAN_01384600 [Vigna angularis var. angularis]
MNCDNGIQNGSLSPKEKVHPNRKSFLPLCLGIRRLEISFLFFFVLASWSKPPCTNTISFFVLTLFSQKNKVDRTA